MSEPVAVDVTIIVKALNEERHIAACLASAKAALQGLNGEILLADSVSADRTVEIARQMNVRIVQFESVADRNCGATLQLGYQFAQGSYIYVLDGDMTLEPDFIIRALAYLKEHPNVAGVGGKLIDTQFNTLADRFRAARYAALRTAQEVDVLGGGGLYRRAAIEEVGYLAHRGLPAFEELELGVRLRSKGYRLVRLPDAAISHTGHNETSYQMLMRLWRNGRIRASGSFLRSALGRPWMGRALRHCWFVFVAPLLYLACALLAAAAVAAGVSVLSAGLLSLLMVWLPVLLALLWKKRSLSEAGLSLLTWHMYAVGAIPGLLRAVRDPGQAIPARIIAD